MSQQDMPCNSNALINCSESRQATFHVSRATGLLGATPKVTSLAIKSATRSSPKRYTIVTTPLRTTRSQHLRFCHTFSSQFLLHVPSVLSVAPSANAMIAVPINVPQPVGRKGLCFCARFMKLQALLPLPVMHVFHKASGYRHIHEALKGVSLKISHLIVVRQHAKENNNLFVCLAGTSIRTDRVA
ncbi:hypothetical protein CFELI_07615 [Corynebacterium felinum]|uniref:Uncharacterized protein n=1 Tax=Corynebacterium felinum TaxID=131318 RepID=A0ABU2BBN9_9CORY|nr:hypothetical protein [Corynebacterium felinum]WJY95137.1 hypothetical protein CFELI_07615 [Corynebacterium felinum]